MNDSEANQAPQDEDPLAPTPVDQAASDAADPRDAEIEGLKAELAQAKDQMLRALAETDNIRRRSVKEREDAGKYAVSGFAKDLLDFADNVRRALEAIPPELKSEGDERIGSLITGLEAMEQQMLRAFERHGIKKIVPMDEVFNPNFHEVMFEAPMPGKAPGTVIQVVEPGYLLHDRLLRAARVGVAKGDGGHAVDKEA